MPENLRDFTDAKLAAMTREHHRDAFAELSARYLGLIRAKAQLFEGAAAPDKEDLWQEGLVGLYVAAITFRTNSGAAFSTYAGVCVYNRMASAVRRHGSSRNRVLNESVSLEDAGDSLSSGENPERVLELRENFQAFRRRLEEALSPLERQALSLYLGGYRRREAAEKAGISLRAFDNALHRVRKKLKRIFSAPPHELHKER